MGHNKTHPHYHFIGIGGIGMSGLARILLQQRKKVTGSDVKTSGITEMLKLEGACVYIGHDAGVIQEGMTVIVSSDIPQDNPELLQAQALKCPIMHRSDLLLSLLGGFKPLVVAGSHGKTTTSSLLTSVLIHANWDPAFAVGGILKESGSNAGYGRGQYFVAEMDESDGSFLKYSYCAAIVTNIGKDHLNFYQTQERLIEAFIAFMRKAPRPDLLFYCIDDPILNSVRPQGISYGTSEDAVLRATKIRQEGWKMIFDVDFRGYHYSNVEVNLVGKHNVLNALAVFGLAISLGVPEASIRSAFAEFKGVARRMDIKGNLHEILVIDDYAHHPREIAATIKACRRAIGDKRLFVVYQPHRYSRMAHCLGQFKDVFDEVDELLVTDLYTAGERPIPGIDSESIFRDIKSSCRGRACFVPKPVIISQLLAHLRPHDVVLMLGAGDITKISGDLVQALSLRPARKIKVGVVSGGMSCEHEVSRRSAGFILSSLREDIYDVTEFVVSREGVWSLANHEDDNAISASRRISDKVFRAIADCDIFIPVFHGPFGEDGIPQGFFEMLGIPYVGCDHRACAIAMDKALTKHVARSIGIATAPFKSFDLYTWTQQRPAILMELHKRLQFPLFVKATHLGSSLAVYKVEEHSQLEQAIDDVFKHDTHVIIESSIPSCREIEFAVLGNSELAIPLPGEVLTGGDFYDYESKYTPDAVSCTAQAQLSMKQAEEGRFLAEKIYRALGCQGLARVDFFLDKQGRYWFNEVNPIPGFTETSLYPKIWTAKIPATELIDLLIVLAFARKRHVDSVFGADATIRAENLVATQFDQACIER